MSEREILVGARSAVATQLRSAQRHLAKAQQHTASAQEALVALGNALRDVKASQEIVKGREAHIASNYRRPRKVPHRIHRALARAEAAVVKALADVNATALTPEEKAVAKRSRQRRKEG